MKWLLVFCVLLAYVTSIHGCHEVTCSSLGYEYKRCVVPGTMSVSRMTLLDRYSNSACVLGNSFGATKSSIWVDKGCRAKFRVCQTNPCPNFSQVDCSSYGYKYDTCLVSSGSRIVLNAWVDKKYSSSGCDHGDSFGTSQGSIWVDNGCRARFNVCYLRIR